MGLLEKSMQSSKKFSGSKEDLVECLLVLKERQETELLHPITIEIPMKTYHELIQKGYIKRKIDKKRWF